jgi:ribosome-associated protein
MMKPEHLKERKLEHELVFTSSRSGGPGGQNVNKVSTKVELRFDIFSTTLFTEVEKELILKKLKNKINKEGVLVLVSQAKRSQLMNKEVVLEKFYELVSKSLTMPAKRLATKPTHASKRKRLAEKKMRADLKKSRGASGVPEE